MRLCLFVTEWTHGGETKYCYKMNLPLLQGLCTRFTLLAALRNWDYGPQCQSLVKKRGIMYSKVIEV